MKFKITKAQFIEGLKGVQNIVGAKSSLPILQNVLLEAEGNTLTMTTTDLDISIKSSVECEVVESGSSTLPAKLLFNSISKAGEVPVEVDVGEEQKGTIVAGSAKFRLSGLPSSDFPRLPEGDDSFVYEMESQTLKEMLRKTAYAASQDDTRRTLKGVLMGFKDMKLTMVATDGRRLALVEKEMEISKDSERDIVLPSKTVQELQRSLGSDGNVKIMVEKSQVCFEMKNLKIYSKLIDDVYPNYSVVIPREHKETIAIDRQLLLDALERTSVMSMDEAHSIRLSFEDNRLSVSSAASEIGSASDEVPIKYAGEKIEIMFNPTYVMDPLKAIDDDEVRIEIKDGHAPVVIRCSIPFLYVLMPLRVA